MIRYFINFDVETTDLHEVPNVDVKTVGKNTEYKLVREGAILQLSGQICIYDTESKTLDIKKCFDYKIKPHKGATISPKALERNGITEEMYSTWGKPSVACDKLKSLMRQVLLKTQYGLWDEKFFLSGYNVQFDTKWLKAFFKRYSDKSLFDFTNYYPLDTFTDNTKSVFFSSNADSKTLPNLQLGTFCGKKDIAIKAHDAFSDSLATLRLFIMSTFDTTHEIEDIILPDGSVRKASDITYDNDAWKIPESLIDVV